MAPQNIIHAHLFGGPHDGLDIVVCPSDKFVPLVLTIAGRFDYHHRRKDAATGHHVYSWPGYESLANVCQISNSH